MTADTPAWVRDAVFYQIFPDRFAASERVHKPGPMEPWDTPPTTHGFKGGDLVGIAERLPYLADLGVTALYLTPIFSSASNHRYHTYDYFTVDPLLGGNDGLRTLLDAAHARGMRVVLDGVFNHTGRGFWPFHHVLETGADSPYRSWFHVDEAFLAAGHRLHAYPPTEGRQTGLGYEAWWDLPALPKLNTDDPDVREYLFSVAEHWLRFGIDGWRLDVPAEIDDEAFWQEFRRRCRAIRPDAYLVGEIWHLAPGLAARRPLRCPDELPAGRGDHGVRRRAVARHGRRPEPPRVRTSDGAARRGRVRRQAAGHTRRVRPGDRDLPAEPAELARRPADADRDGRRRRGRPPRDDPPDDPARRPVHLLRRRDRVGRRQRSGVPGRLPMGPGRRGTSRCSRSFASSSACARPSRPCATARRGSSRPLGTPSPSSDASTDGRSSSPSTRDHPTPPSGSGWWGRPMVRSRTSSRPIADAVDVGPDGTLVVRLGPRSARILGRIGD